MRENKREKTNEDGFNIGWVIITTSDNKKIVNN